MLNISLSPFPTLVTDRLILRAMTIKDADAIRILRSNDSVNQYIERPKTITLEEAGNFIKKIEASIANNETFYWAIALKEDNKLIGTICLWKINIEEATAEIGYELIPAMQGKGIMNEAIAAVIKLSFKDVHLKVITAFLQAENTKSINVLARNNFRPDTEYSYSDKEEADGFICYYLKQEDYINQAL